jgi:hypothetical protein
VYFGTTNPPTFRINQTSTTYDTGTMANGTTYYWRIDEKNASYTTTGDIWSFTTIAKQTLISSSTDGGNVTTPGEGNFQFDNGTVADLVATADANYRFVNWTGTAVTAGKVANPNSAATTVTMDGDYDIAANFVINQLAITGTAGANGSISPSGTFNKESGSSQLFTATPTTGYYEVDKWKVDGVDVQTGGTTYTLSNITAAHTVAVSFKIFTYTVTASAGANGSISPSGTFNKDYGSSQLFAATPTMGYEVDKWQVDGADAQTGGNTYTLNNITAAHTVAVTFKLLPTYTITGIAGANGSIDPASAVVYHGSSKLFTAMPATGYEVDKWSVDSVDVQTGGNTYMLSNITAAHTVTVTFKMRPAYTVTGTAGANGSIIPTSVVVYHGDSQLFTATADTGYGVDKWTVDGADVQTGGTAYTLINITAAHTVAVSFKILTYTITGAAGANGSIDPTSDITKDYGSSQCFTGMPNSGYEIDSWYLDGSLVQTGGGYCLNNITANHTVSVTFKILTYTVTASTGANGSINPTGDITKDYGSSQLFTATPTTGYAVDTWQVDGADVQTGGNTYTLSNITATHTVAVSFKIMTYTVTGTSGANGSIDPVGNITKDYGSSQIFTATPTTDYEVDKWTVDGADVQTGGTAYTLINITAAHTVAVRFKIFTYTVTASAGANGSIDPTGGITKDYGSSQCFTGMPNSGYEIDSWYLDGSLVQTGGGYCLNNITANHTVSVTFKILTYTITGSAGANGSISPTSAVVNYGGSQLFTASANTGYMVNKWQVDGVDVQTGGNTYTITNVTATHTVTVSFVVVPPSQATTPTPANSATNVGITTDLSWTAGARATSHDVYFGTASTPPLVSNSQTGTTYDTGTMANGTTYYWRIDEKNAGGTTTGAVWSFTTVTSIPTFVAAGAVTSGTGTITPALPSGIATNDILLLFLETSNQAISISNSNGGTWTAVTNSPQSTGTAASTTGARLTVFWSRYNGTQGAPTASDSGDHQLGRIIAVRGAVASGNPWNVTAGGVEATADTSGSIAGATTTVANTLVVAAIATALPDSSTTSNFSSWTNSNLASVTERTDNTVTAGNGGGLGITTGGKAAAGAYGNTAVTCASSSYKAMMSIAIRP